MRLQKPYLVRVCSRMLAWLPGRTREIAQRRNVWTVGANSHGIYRQAQSFGNLKINARVIKFGKAEARGRMHAIDSRRRDGARWAATLPAPLCYLEKLMPIASIPHSSPLSGTANSTDQLFDAHGLLCVAYYFREQAAFSAAATAFHIRQMFGARLYKSPDSFKHVTTGRVAPVAPAYEYCSARYILS